MIFAFNAKREQAQLIAGPSKCFRRDLRHDHFSGGSAIVFLRNRDLVFLPQPAHLALRRCKNMLVDMGDRNPVPERLSDHLARFFTIVQQQ